MLLDDGSVVLGVLGEPFLCEGQREISEYGGWRAYIGSARTIVIVVVIRGKGETMNNAATAGEVRFWVPGDWNGFFGLFTNVLLNVIVLTGLCLGVVQLPADTVFGRILPALGIALPLGNLFYAYLAWQLGKAEGRSDVTAMPYGPSVPHMFIVVFLSCCRRISRPRTRSSRGMRGSPGASSSASSCCWAPSSARRSAR